LEWVIIADLDNETKPLDPEFEVAGIRVQPLRLYHGGTYICLGFVFGEEGSRVAYLSDVKVIPPPTLEYLRSITIDTLILDALFVDVSMGVFFCCLSSFHIPSLRENIPPILTCMKPWRPLKFLNLNEQFLLA